MLGINKKPVMYESSDVYCVQSLARLQWSQIKKVRKETVTKLNCADQKYWWTQGYENWNKEQFKRVTRE